MKLIYRITLRLTLILLPLLAIWGVVFYVSLINEVNDETDDALEWYSEQVMRRVLVGEELSTLSDGTNNSYSLREVSKQYADENSRIIYFDTIYYIANLNDYEPARVLRTIFKTDDARYYQLTVSTPTIEKADIISAILNKMIMLYVVVICTIVVVVLLMLKRSMRPLFQMLDWLNAYNPGTKKEAINVKTNTPEFEQLKIALQDAVDRSESVFEHQKQFIGNASHELQTPLAVIGNRIDWMVDQMNLNEEQLHELFLIKKELRHLVRLNKTLLLLTKIDNHQFPETTDVDIVKLIRELRETFEEVYHSKAINCICVLPNEYIVMMNESLANILISNLLKNAFVHAPERSQLKIEIKNDCLRISNNGETALDKDKIFDRFYQGNKKEGSSGLGLALVYAIVDYYNLKIDYHFSENRHLFELLFR